MCININLTARNRSTPGQSMMNTTDYINLHIKSTNAIFFSAYTPDTFH